MAVLPERKMSDAWLASVISNTASDAALNGKCEYHSDVE